MPTQPLKQAQEAYRAVLGTSTGRDVLNDLVLFAQQCTDPVRALGRADVVMRFLREQKRARDSGSTILEQENET